MDSMKIEELVEQHLYNEESDELVIGDEIEADDGRVGVITDMVLNADPSPEEAGKIYLTVEFEDGTSEQLEYDADDTAVEFADGEVVETVGTKDEIAAEREDLEEAMVPARVAVRGGKVVRIKAHVKKRLTAAQKAAARARGRKLKGKKLKPGMLKARAKSLKVRNARGL